MEKDPALEFERWRERKKIRVNELLDRFIKAHCSSVILEKALRHALFAGGKNTPADCLCHLRGLGC